MKETLKNEQIVLAEVRLIGPESEQLGSMSSAAALQIAEEKGEVNGRTAFEAAKQGDKAGQEVVDMMYDACGLSK